MEIMANVCESMMWILFLCMLCPEKRDKKIVAAGGTLAVLLLLLNITLADKVVVYSNYTFLNDFLITFLFAMVFLEGTWYWKVFLILFYNITLLGCNFLCTNILVSIFHIKTEEMISTDGAFRLALIACSKGMLLCLFYTAYKMKEKIRNLEKMGVSILLLPILTFSIVVVLIQIFAKFYEDTMDVIWVIWLIVLILISFFVCFRFAYGAYRGREERKISQLLRAQIAIQQQTYEQQYQNIRKVRKHQHDIKHKLVVIEQLLIRQEYEKAREYTKDYLTELENINVFKYGDSVVSTLLLLKEESARKYHIEMNVQIPDMHIKRMSELDISVVLGNLLDNAIEAEKNAEKERRINVYVYEKQLLYICVENKMDTETSGVHFTEHSSKENAQLHGFGIPRIRELVEKYHGEMEIGVKEGWFRAEIYI